MMRKNKLAAAVVMSVLACSVCQSVWADDRVSVSADGKTLTLKNINANNTANNYFGEKNGVYVIAKDDGSSFDTIEHSDFQANSQDAPFIITSSDGRTYDILANTIDLKSKNETAVIYNSAINSVINIGKKNSEIKNLTIHSGYGTAGTIARVRVGGNNSQNNFFVENMTLELDKSFGVDSTSPLAIGVEYSAKNCSIEINASKKLIIVGDIGNGRIKENSNVTWTISENSSIEINSDPDYNGSVQLTGNIYSYNIMKPLFTSWEARDNYTNINFIGKDSFFTGSVDDNVYGWNGATKLPFHDKEGVHLKFTDGARWNMTGNSKLAQLDASDGAVIDLTYEENATTRSARTAANTFKTLAVLKDFNGAGAIVKMKINGTVDPNTATNSDKLIVLGEHTGNTQIDITNIGSDYSKAVGTVLAQVGNERGSFTVKDIEGALTWVQYEVDNEEDQSDHSTNWFISNAQTVTSPITPVNPDPGTTDPGTSDPVEPLKPTTSVSTLLSTITAGYDTWRSDTDKLSERLGELRLNGKDTEGVWVRTKGSKFGRHGGNGVYTNKQQTYQLGYDAVTSKNADQTTYTGVAAEYGKGNLSFEHGTGTMKSFGLGLYQTQMRESGHYLDFVYKFDKYKNDFHVADTAGNPISGKYGNNAMSLSAEYGRQNALKHGWYVEPQAELTLGYMWGNDFVTSNNIRVEQKNMPALIGRLGLNIGRNIGDKVNFYVKASMNHDFLGKYDLHMTDLTTGDRLNANDNFGSSWFDYGAGLTVRTSNNSYAYFDIERAVGGEYKKNWDWNVGLRWSF